MARERSHEMIYGLIFVVVVLCLALPNPYYLDDFILLRDNAWLLQGPPSGGWFTNFLLDSFDTFPGFRPILMWSFWINAKILGVHPWSFRLVNILIHLANVVLLAKFLRSFSSNLTDRRWTYFSALLFAIHPVQTLGINFLWKRSTLLESFWMLSSLCLHARERRKGGYGWRAVAGQLLLLLLAVGTKESGALLPFLLLGYDVIFLGGKYRLKRTEVCLFSLLLLAVMGFIGFRFGYVNSWLAEHRAFLITRDQLSGLPFSLFSLSLFPDYLQFWLVPSPRVIDDPPLRISVPSLFLTGFILFGSFFAAWKARSPLLRFMTFFVAVTLLAPMAPVSLFFAMDQIRLYLPLAGLSFLLVISLDRLLRWAEPKMRGLKPILRTDLILMLLALSYAAHTVGQQIRFHEPTLIWQDVAEAYPESDLAWGELGSALQDHQDFHAATLAFLSAAKLNPKRQAYLIRAFHNMYLNGQSLEDVKPILMRIDPNGVGVPDVVNLANMSRELGETQRALELYVNAISRNPKFGPAHLQFAYLLESLGNKSKAHDFYQKARELMPREKLAQEGYTRTL